jgi:hypothetical protein
LTDRDDVAQFADSILDENERMLGQHLAELLGSTEDTGASLIAQILPIYCEKRGDTACVFEPRNVYKSLHYIDWHWKDRPADTRYLMHMTGQHIESCLKCLAEHAPRTPSSLRYQPLGKRLIEELEKAGALPSGLAEHLLTFSFVINVPAKHISAKRVNAELDKRTFSVLEAALAFVIMRKLSIQLFDILRENGVVLPQGWKDFNEDWLQQ